MHLAVNAVRLTRPFTGVGRFVECLLAEWSEMRVPFDRITLFAPKPFHSGVAFPLDRFNVVTGGPGGPDPLWESRFLNAHAHDIDVLFGPSYTLPIGYPGRCVVMNHGPSENRALSYEWARSLAYEQLYRWSARRADHVLANSKSVKRRLVELYRIASDKITVNYLGASRWFVPIDDDAALTRARQSYVASDAPFTLFVGKLARRHSIPNLIKAFARVTTRTDRHKLVLVGPNYLGLDVPELAHRAGVGDVVVHHQFVKHRDLPALYSAAEEVIFPATDAEGFGLPVIEAMACGTPVVSVNRGSIPEFASGAALLVDSSSIDDLASGLQRMIGETELRHELARKGLERSKTITWRVTAERVLDELWRVAQTAAEAQAIEPTTERL